MLRVPGFPHSPSNGSVAWCITHASADYQDLYVERFDSAATRHRYEFQDPWVQAETYGETIEADGAEPVEIDKMITRHGPDRHR